MKKKIIVIPIIVVLVLVFVIGGLLLAYLLTDAFKSNKQLFFKYMSENSGITEISQGNELNAYIEKQKTTPYTSKGSIRVDMATSDNSQSNLVTLLQKGSITFDGSVDKANNYAYYKVKLNYSDTQSLDFDLVRNGDIYATKINDVLNKFVGIENNNLKEFAKRMGLNEQTAKSVPDKIDSSQNNQIKEIFNDVEWKEIANKYLNIVSDSLTDDMFSKENTVYTLTLKDSDLTNIATNVLSTLKNDDITLNKIKQILIDNMGLSTEQADSYIEAFKNQDISTKQINENFTIKISVDKSEKGMTIEIANEQENTLAIAFKQTKTASEIQYNINASYNNTKIFDLTTSYTGIDTDTVEEKLVLELEENSNTAISNSADMISESINSLNAKLVCTFTNTKTFGVEINKEDISNNLLLLNNAPNAQAIEKLFNQISARLGQINSQKLQAAMSEQQQSSQQQGTTSNENTGNQDNNLTNAEIQTFNSMWESYSGRNISASSVRALIAGVITNNSSSEHKVTVNGELPTAMPDLDKTKTYTITLKHDTNGYVNEITYESEETENTTNESNTTANQLTTNQTNQTNKTN